MARRVAVVTRFMFFSINNQNLSCSRCYGLAKLPCVDDEWWWLMMDDDGWSKASTICETAELSLSSQQQSGSKLACPSGGTRLEMNWKIDFSPNRLTQPEEFYRRLLRSHETCVSLKSSWRFLLSLFVVFLNINILISKMPQGVAVVRVSPHVVFSFFFFFPINGQKLCSSRWCGVAKLSCVDDEWWWMMMDADGWWWMMMDDGWSKASAICETAELSLRNQKQSGSKLACPSKRTGLEMNLKKTDFSPNRLAPPKELYRRLLRSHEACMSLKLSWRCFSILFVKLMK